LRCLFALWLQEPRNRLHLPNPKELRTLGDHLRKTRLNLGILQREVAERLGADRTTITNWERTRTSPSLRFVQKIIEFLDYVPHYTTPRTLRERILAARRLGIDPSTLGRWESSDRRPCKEPAERLDIFLSSVIWRRGR